MGHWDMQGSRGSCVTALVTDGGRVGSQGLNQWANAKVHRKPREKFALGNTGFRLQLVIKGLVCGRRQFGSGGSWQLRPPPTSAQTVGGVKVVVGEIIQGEGRELERGLALGLGACLVLRV